MRFGVWTPLPHVIRAEPAMEASIAAVATPGADGPDHGLDLAVSIVQEAERLGFDLTLIAERFLGPDHAAWILATALACHTRTMEIMVAAHPGIVPPQVVAKMGATLDRISGGRFSVNVVNGWWQEEMDLFGNGAWLPGSDARYRRMDEFIQVVRGMWTQNSLDFKGDYFTANDQPLPFRPVQPCPPIYAASRDDRGKDIIARHCDCWFVEYEPDHRRYADTIRKVERDVADMRERSARFGRTLRYGISAHVIVADTPDAAEADAVDLEQYGTRDRIALVSAKGLGAGLVGTPAEVARRLKSYESAGVEILMLRFHPMMEGLRSFADRVMPLL
jgi:FMNH2-dependent dimethyl sulfone monooxygenase